MGRAAEAAETAEGAAAVSILNQLWQRDQLLARPKYSIVPLSCGPTGEWRCTLFVRTRHVGDVEVDGVSVQKKIAKQMAASKAVERLRRRGIPAIDDINVFERPSQGDEKGEAAVAGVAAEEAIRRGGCDGGRGVVGCGALVTGFRSERVPGASECSPPFMIPAEMNIVVARTSQHVDNWIEENVQDGKPVGLYVDSKSARQNSRHGPQNARGQMEDDGEPRASEACQVIALSTQASSLLVCAESLRAAEIGESWIPKSLTAFLERKECVKVGIALDYGAVALRSAYAIHCLGMRCLDGLSYSLTKSPACDDTKDASRTASQLVANWLQQRLFQGTEAWVDGVEELASFSFSSRRMLAHAICFCFVLYGTVSPQRAPQICQ